MTTSLLAGGDVDAVIAGAKSLKQLQADKAFELTYKPALSLNQRYLGDLPSPIGVSGSAFAKGTGKTHALKSLVNQSQATGRKHLLLTHRIATGKAISSDTGITWDGDRSPEAQEMKRLFGHGQCVDSLHKKCSANFDPHNWEGAVVIIDEVEQVIWHVLNSSTCKDKRIEILKNLRALLQCVISTGGLIIVQDADLSDWSLNFIRAQARLEIQPWIVTNDYKATDSTYDATFFDTQSDPGIAKNDPSELLRSAAQEVNAGGKVFIALDAQKPKSIWGSRNIEKFLQRQCPQARIIRIDRETLGNPHHAAHGCEERINETVA
ncbi:bifunctional DNA primase/helicase, partial [Oscillatoria laete-virens NRMC-F 0139]|nr:bifunctional DNA primase/helicase [Oscillatoria laete-virens NRMC-F 0139]